MSENFVDQDPAGDICLDVYGCLFRLTGNAKATINNLADDFRFFVCSNTENPIVVEVTTENPPYDTVPQGIATTYTPRNVSFSIGGCKYIDYGGRGLAIWDRSRKFFRISTLDEDIRYEATYLFLLSCIGDNLDRKHIHRVHACALSVNGQAILAILPMGGGKSTLCSALLKYREFQLLSDDSPFIADDGRVLAFPLRLGLLPGNESGIPSEYRRTINRMEFGPKVLVGYDYFADRVSPSAKPGIVFLGRRTMTNECKIEPAGKWAQFKSIIVNCVVGLGLYQGLEFVLTHSPIELLSKIPIAWSRLRIAGKLFAKSKVYVLTLGRDQALNADTVRAFVKKKVSEIWPNMNRAKSYSICLDYLAVSPECSSAITGSNA